MWNYAKKSVSKLISREEARKRKKEMKDKKDFKKLREEEEMVRYNR